MASIKCRECGKDISENADKCPHCGHVVSSIAQRYSQFYKPSEPPNQPKAANAPEYTSPPSWYQEPYKKRPARRTSVLGVFALMLSLLSCTLSVMAVITVQNLSDNITKDVINYLEPYTKAVQEIKKEDQMPDGEAETENKTSSSQNQTSSQNEYLIGETWTVDGQWALTIDSITETEDRNEYYEKTPTQVFLIDFTYENLGYQDEKGLMDGLFFDLSGGQIVDSKGFMGYSYPGDIINQAKETPVGAKCQAQECIGVDNESTEIKIIVSKYDGNGTSQEAAFILPIPKDQAFIKETEDGENEDEDEENGVLGIEAQNSNHNYLSDFSYKLSGNRIILNGYSGDNEILEIRSSYEIDGESYETDISDFEIGDKNQHINTLILEEGITNVSLSLFDSCNVQTVFFPKSINIVYDYTLSYLQPDINDTIKIYYGGTKDDWLNIFTKYNEEPTENTEDAGFEEKAGASLANGAAGTDEAEAAGNTAGANGTDTASETAKPNKTGGNKYDSSLFEYFFSANPDDLK